MKIRELIKKRGMTSSMVSKVKTYSEEVDIPMEQYVKLIDTSVMFKKLHGFYSLKSLLDVFDNVELVMLYTTIAEHSEIVLFSCKKGRNKYTIAGTLSVDTMSAGREKIPNKDTLDIHNNMLDKDVSHFGFYDFQLGFSSASMDISASLVSTLVGTQVEKTKFDTNREYKLGLIVQTKNGLNLSVQNIEYNS
ncbi:MAG: hypothetical protein KAH32_08530, partial [Chlamydiia bacterium]|nr:hypothetical protein [Chlamydiia bacterium]